MDVDEEDLKDLIKAALDPTIFLDLVGWDFGDMVDGLYDQLNEEQREELKRALT